MPQTSAETPSRAGLGEIGRYFARLGFTAFGGPAAHIAMMEEELVHRRAWLSRQHFLDLVAAVNFIPGPASTELAISLGRLRGGWRGLLVAGVCFIVPAVLIILPISWLYVNYHQLPHVTGVLHSVSAAVVAIMVAAVVRLGKSAIKDGFTVAIAVAAALAEWISHLQRWTWGDVLILAAAGLAGLVRSTALTRGTGRSATTRSFALYPLATLPGGLAALLGGPAVMTALFFKIGATLFGSGYVLATYLQTSFVDNRAWLTPQQVLDAVAVGQVTPGPLLTTATFVGFLLGHQRFGGGLAMEVGCALAATMAIFAPAFVMIAALGPGMDRLQRGTRARGALDAMNAAVVGLIASTCILLARQAMQPPLMWPSGLLVAASLVVLLATRINSTWIIAAAAIAGWLIY